MTPAAELLVDGFDRVRAVVHRVLADVPVEQLAWRPDAGANPIGWLVWHLTRVQDDHLADAAGTGQVWMTAGWVERFGLDRDPAAIGFGDSSAEVARVRIGDPGLLADYHDAVHEQTTQWVGQLSDADLARVVDDSWDPPVTLGVRLVSVLDDDLEHAGQAAYIRGLLDRST